MALPSVTLPAGTYSFEIVNPTSSADAVLVTSGTRSRTVHFLGLTRRQFIYN
jgi:hypothetical protein